MNAKDPKFTNVPFGLFSGPFYAIRRVKMKSIIWVKLQNGGILGFLGGDLCSTSASKVDIIY